MKFEDITDGCNYEYNESCDCGKNHCVLTQYGNFSEYYTDVYVKCDCGQYVWFDLPVN